MAYERLKREKINNNTVDICKCTDFKKENGYYIAFNHCYLFSKYCFDKLGFKDGEYTKSFYDFEGKYKDADIQFYFSTVEEAERYIEEIIAPRLMFEKMKV